MPHIATDDLIASLFDVGSWKAWDRPLSDVGGRDHGYAEALAKARERTGRDESVLTGSARIAGVPVAVVASDFRFLGGSMGRDAALRIVRCVERATEQGLPLIGLPNSGGTRMQEGTPAFLLMIAIAEAILRHRTAGLPYLVYLRNPTTGGVYATWGSLGDVAHAQPGALVGFLGPRVYEGLTGEPFPEGVQTGEHLARCGVIDGVAEPREWRDIAAKLLHAWEERRTAPTSATTAAGEPRPDDAGVGASTATEWTTAGSTVAAPAPPGSPGSNDAAAAGGDAVELREAGPAPRRAGPADADANSPMPDAASLTGWEAVTATRRPDRKGVRDLLALAADTVPLSGTQRGEVASATVLAVTRIGGVPCVVVGQDRAAQAEGRSVGPADLRVAQRALHLARRWRLPVLLVVDTHGGELSASAESGALAGEIARCLSDLAAITTPTLCLLLGAGSGGAALALVPADRVVASADAWISPLPPEGASLISYRTTDRADELANAQRITAPEMAAVGAVDRIIPGPDPDLTVTAVMVAEELAALAQRPVDIGGRADRWLRPAHVAP